MQRVDRQIVADNKTYFKLTQEKYGLRPPKILANFTKAEQIKKVQEEADFRKSSNAPSVYQPSDSEWKMIERVVFVRKERSCPICFGLYGGEKQLITSCRHTFHERCYLSFLKSNPQ